MPHYLNDDLRTKLVRQACEIYFPSETDMVVTKSLSDIFQAYCEKAYGPVPPFVSKDHTYTIDLAPDIPTVSFTSFWLRAPFLQPTVISYTTKLSVDVDACPVPGLIDTARALASYRASRSRFSESLYGELLKYATTETFLRRFPALEGAFAMVLGEKTAVDLPVECAVDVNSIAEFLSV